MGQEPELLLIGKAYSLFVLHGIIKRTYHEFIRIRENEDNTNNRKWI